MKRLCLKYGNNTKLITDGNLVIGSAKGWISLNDDNIPRIVARVDRLEDAWYVKSDHPHQWPIRSGGKNHEKLLLKAGTTFSIGDHTFEIAEVSSLVPVEKSPNNQKPPQPVPEIPPSKTLQHFFDRPIYKLGLIGSRESGKTCILAALSMARKPSKVPIIRHEVLQMTEKAKKRTDLERQRLLKEFTLGQERLNAAIDKLKKGAVPPPTGDADAISAMDAGAHSHLRFIFQFGGNGRIFEIEDYGGEFLASALAHEEKTRRILGMLKNVHGLFVLCETPRDGADPGLLNDSLRDLTNLLATVAPLDHAPSITVLINKWDRQRDNLADSDPQREREILDYFLSSDAPGADEINKCVEVLKEKVGAENVTITPISALGHCEMIQHEDGISLERPVESNPLRSFGLEEAFIDLLDRIDEREIALLQYDADRFLAYPQQVRLSSVADAVQNRLSDVWKTRFTSARKQIRDLPRLRPKRLGGQKVRENAEGILERVENLKKRGVAGKQLDRIHTRIQRQLQWSTPVWSFAGTFCLSIFLLSAFLYNNGAQFRQLEADLRTKIRDTNGAAEGDLATLTNTIATEAESLTRGKTRKILRKLRPDYQDFLLRYVNHPLSSGVGSSLDLRIWQIENSSKDLERRISRSQTWRQDLCVAKAHLEHAAKDYELYVRIRDNPSQLSSLGPIYLEEAGIPGFMRTEIDQRLNKREKAVLHLTGFESDRDFRYAHLSGSIFSQNDMTAIATINDEVTKSIPSHGFFLTSFNATPQEELRLELELETRPPRWWIWSKAIFTNDNVRLVPGRETEIVLAREDKNEEIRLRYRLAQSTGVLPGWNGRYTEFGLLREGVPVACGD